MSPPKIAPATSDRSLLISSRFVRGYLLEISDRLHHQTENNDLSFLADCIVHVLSAEYVLEVPID